MANAEQQPEAWKNEDVVVQTDIDAGKVSDENLARIGATAQNEAIDNRYKSPDEYANLAMQEELDRRQEVAADAGDSEAAKVRDPLFDRDLEQEMREKAEIGKEERDRQKLSEFEDIAREILPEYDSASPEAQKDLIEAIEERMMKDKEAKEAEEARKQDAIDETIRIMATTIAKSPLTLEEFRNDLKKNPVPAIEPRENSQ
jgi:hypothetical protein